MNKKMFYKILEWAIFGTFALAMFSHFAGMDLLLMRSVEPSFALGLYHSAMFSATWILSWIVDIPVTLLDGASRVYYAGWWSLLVTEIYVFGILMNGIRCTVSRSENEGFGFRASLRFGSMAD